MAHRVKDFVVTHATLLLLTILAIVASLGIGSSVDPDSENGQVLCLALVITLYCCRVLLNEYKLQRLFSPLSCYSALIIIHFSLPGTLLAFELIELNYEPNRQYLEEGLFFVLLCFAMIHLGTLLAGGLLKTKAKAKEETFYFWGRLRSWVLVVFLVVVGWLDRVYMISEGEYFQLDRTAFHPGTWYALFAMIEQFPMYALVICLIAHFHRKMWSLSAQASFRIALVLGLAELIYWMGTGRKFETILILVFPVVIRYIYTRRLPPKSVVLAGLLSIVLLFPASFYYRSSLEQSSGFKMQLNLIPKIASEAVDLVDGIGPAAEIIANRINLNESVAASVRLIDSNEWQLRFGMDYSNILVILVPRFLWPGKPGFHYGTEFGHAAGLSPLTNDLTSISVTYFGEAYLNLTWGGCLVFIVFGFFAEKIFQSANNRHDPKWVLLYCLLLPPLLYIGGTVAMYFGGYFKILILFFVLGTWLAVYRRRRLSIPAGMATDNMASRRQYPTVT